jgi:hypothetical protein
MPDKSAGSRERSAGRVELRAERVEQGVLSIG